MGFKSGLGQWDLAYQRQSEHNSKPDQDVCISGDSSIQMSIQEVGTLAQYD